MFDDVRLPEEIERGVQGGPGFSTTIVTLASGSEARNQEWEISRGNWQVGYGIQDRDQLLAVYNFFMARRGRARGFRFKDWNDHTAELQSVGTVAGDPLRRQLRVVYPDTLNPYTRTIVLPVTGTLEVFVDLILTTDYVLEADGVLLFPDDPGSNVIANFEFDLPCRFDTDDFGMVLETFDAGRIPNIPIVELKAD